MSDCPYCGWRYDPYAACVMARPTGDAMPVLYRDGRLRTASPTEGINAKAGAVGAHICFEHPMEPDVLIFGPIARWEPLQEANAVLTVLGGLLR